MSDKIEPCPVCLDKPQHTWLIGANSAQPTTWVAGCIPFACGQQMDWPLAAWNAYARERRVGRIVLREFGFIVAALHDQGVESNADDYDRVRKEIVRAAEGEKT